jgi:N-acetyl-anhydromuramyl-L-alanine amidase AmpD
MTRLYVIEIKLQSYIGFSYNSYENSDGDLLSEIVLDEIQKDITGPFVTGYSRFPQYSSGDSSTSELVIDIDVLAQENKGLIDSGLSPLTTGNIINQVKDIITTQFKNFSAPFKIYFDESDAGVNAFAGDSNGGGWGLYVALGNEPPPDPPVPTTVPPVASQVVTPTPPTESVPAPPPPGKLYNGIVFNVEKNNILVPIQNTFELGELTIVKRDYAPPLPVSANPPPTDIGEFSNMAPTDVPPTAPSGKSSPSGYTIKGTSYRVANRKPTQIVLHYTAGWQMTDKNQGTVNFLQSRENGRGLTYHFIIGVDGHIENLVDPKNVAYHGTDSNQNSIGISLASLGTTFHSNNTLASADARIDKLKSKSLYKLNEYHAELVNFDEKKSTYRSIKFSQEVSDAQLRSLSSLLKKIRQDFPDIPAWNGLTQDTFDLMFPKSGTSYKTDKPGLYSHCSITTQKADVLPTPRLIKFLKQVRF